MRSGPCRRAVEDGGKRLRQAEDVEGLGEQRLAVGQQRLVLVEQEVGRLVVVADALDVPRHVDDREVMEVDR